MAVSMITSGHTSFYDWGVIQLQFVRASDRKLTDVRPLLCGLLTNGQQVHVSHIMYMYM